MGARRWWDALTTRLGGQPTPPWPDLHPTVEWQVAGRCNYDCSYCIQSPRHRVGAPTSEIALRIVAGLATLPGAWEIKVSGGEPFAYRGFVHEVVPALMAQTPHTLSVLTNLSAPLSVLERFCEAAGERLRITSASLHLEHVEASAFIEKALAYRALRARYNPHSSFVINTVLVPGRLDALGEVKAAIEGAGFRFFPQWMKVGGGVYPYTPRDLERIAALTGDARDPALVNAAPSWKGTWCEAGAWYFVVDQRGDAWSCRTAKRYATADGDDEAWLGNLADGTFKRHRRGGPCPYDICPCTVPANRGIVRRDPASAPALPEGHDGF